MKNTEIRGIATQCGVPISGTGMTNMARKDQSASELAQEAAIEALADAKIQAKDLSLIVFSNALGGALLDQSCVRGQSFLRTLDSKDVPVINIDNSCAGGSAALRMAVAAAKGGEGPIMVLGVEKMWTGDREATIKGIEQGLPAEYRQKMRDGFDAVKNPGGSVLMGLNDSWAEAYMTKRGGTVQHIAAAAVKARCHASLNPKAQVKSKSTLEEVLNSPQVAGSLTRLMCSSFTDGAAAVILDGRPSAPSNRPRIIGSVGRSGNGTLEYHERLAQTADAAWEAFGFGPKDVDIVELHDATSAEELFAAESLGFFDEGDAGPLTFRGATAIGGDRITINPSGGLVGRGHPIGATGIAQIVELAIQLQDGAGPRQVQGARIGVAVNTGGVIEGDAAYVGIHALARS